MLNEVNGRCVDIIVSASEMAKEFETIFSKCRPIFYKQFCDDEENLKPAITGDPNGNTA